MEEIQTQIDDLVERIDENDQNFQDYSDELGTQLQDISDTLSENQDSINTLNESAGQLTFPLTQETIDLIKEQFPTGFVTLVAGTVTLKDLRISPTSNINLSVSLPGGTQGFLSYAASAGQVIITSTSNTETSVISYELLN